MAVIHVFTLIEHWNSQATSFCVGVYLTRLAADTVELERKAALRAENEDIIIWNDDNNPEDGDEADWEVDFIIDEHTLTIPEAL